MSPSVREEGENMFTSRIRLRATTVAFSVTLAALGIAVVSGCTAMADTSSAEASFLDEIGINHATLPGKSTSEMISAGYATCDHLRGGRSVLDETAAVEQTYRFDQGTLFVSAATTNLCPDFVS